MNKQNQVFTAAELVNQIHTGENYSQITNAQVDVVANELVCVFMDRKEKRFIEKRISQTDVISTFDNIKHDNMQLSLLVDVMAAGRMYIYRNNPMPFVIFNNGMDQVMAVPFQIMITKTMEEYGAEPVIQITPPSGFRGSYSDIDRIKALANGIKPFFEVIQDPKAPHVVKHGEVKYNPSYTKVLKIQEFKTKLRITFKVKGGTEQFEISAKDGYSKTLRKMFDGNGGAVGGKLRMLSKSAAEMAKSKLFVIYEKGVAIGAVVTFVHDKDIDNGYIGQASVLKYIQRFNDAGLSENVLSIKEA